MEFPDEIWNHIFSYFHCSYKKPLHYISIMHVDMFKKIRSFHNNSSTNTLALMPFDSFYIYIVASCWIYWSVPDIQHLLLPPDINLSHNVALGPVKDDFIEIWDSYARIQPYNNVLSHIHYDFYF